MKLLILGLLFLIINKNIFALGARRPKTQPAPSPSPTVTAGPTSTPTLPVTVGPYAEEVISLAKNSSCTNYNFKNRGRAPAGFIQGMALSFARSYCRAKKQEVGVNGLVEILTSPNSKRTSSDALAVYQPQFDSLAMPLTNVGSEPMRAVYVLGIGLGMRESSGKYCEGYDKAAGSNRNSSEAEAGLFQTSYNSINFSSELKKLYVEYQNSNSSRCYLETFKQGVDCKNIAFLGSGEGLKFQKVTRECPVFAAEYAMTMLRIARAHYGPINRKEAEVVSSCNEMLLTIQELINKDSQAICSEIF